MKKLKSKIIAGFLCIVMTVLAAGCGSTSQTGITELEQQINANEANSNEANPNEANTKEETETGSKVTIEKRATGRYVESMQQLDNSSMPPNMVKMEDGSLVIMGAYFGKVVSTDNGQTWETADPPSWLSELSKENYISDITLSKEGYVAARYCENSEEASDTEEQEDNGSVEEPMKIIWKYLLVSPEGTQISYGEDLQNINDIRFSDKGELYVLADKNKIHRIDKETGKAEFIIEIEESQCYFNIFGDNLTVMDREGMYFYNLTTKQKIQDTLINDFYKEYVGEFDFYAGNYYGGLILQEEEDIVYIACAKGLFRHVIGGNAIEQIVDGNLNSFSNPSVSFLEIEALEDNSFVVLFTGGAVATYTFDPDMPAVPEIQLTAYSLLENNVIQQAITLFQQKHPDAYVKYEIGMGADSAVTREDALKKLNTRILAGEGPDLLVLDDMPINSYMEKGILADITPYLNELESSEKLIPAVTNTFKKGESIFAIPVRFKIPTIVAESNIIEGINSLKDMADTMEKIRKDYPEGSILGMYVEKQILISLSLACASEWQNSDGSMNTEAVTEFLTQSKRVYEAEMAGVTQEKIDEYKETFVNAKDYTGATYDRSAIYNDITSGGYEIAVGDSKIAIGYIDSSYSLAMVTSAMAAPAAPQDMEFDIFSFLKGVPYLPCTIAGISASAANPKMAGELLAIMVSKENQALSYGGLPNNEEAIHKGFVREGISAGDNIGGMSTNSGDGKDVMLEIKWPEDSAIERYKEQLALADTPNLTDSILKEAIFEVGVSALNGEKTVEQAVKDIESKVAIYMAE